MEPTSSLFVCILKAARVPTSRVASVIKQRKVSRLLLVVDRVGVVTPPRLPGRSTSKLWSPRKESHSEEWLSIVWWASRESNTAPTDYAYQLRFSPSLSGLWSGLSLVFTTCPFSLYTFSRRELRSGLPRRLGSRGFPEFEQFYQGAELTYPKATHSRLTMPCCEV